MNCVVPENILPTEGVFFLRPLWKIIPRFVAYDLGGSGVG